jgi:hypothetical protein
LKYGSELEPHGRILKPPSKRLGANALQARRR